MAVAKGPPSTILAPSVLHWLFGSHPACSLIHTWQVDLRNKVDGGRSVRIVVTAVDVQAVDAVLVRAMWWSQYSSIPVGHHQVVPICQPVGAGL